MIGMKLKLWQIIHKNYISKIAEKVKKKPERECD